MMRDEQVKSIVADLLAEQAPGLAVEQIQARQQFDDSDSEYFDVHVVYTNGAPATTTRAALPRLLISRLNRAGVCGFPVISWIAADDLAAA